MSRQFLPNNYMVGALVEHHILSLLIQLNPLSAYELYYSLGIIVHSVEIVDDELLIAHVEHWLIDDQSHDITRRHFCQVELEPYFADLTLFNTPEPGDNDDDEEFCDETHDYSN